MESAETIKKELVDEYTDEALYDIATYILYQLSEKGFCIWQTYDRMDVQIVTGKKPTKMLMEDLQEQIGNFLERYYND